MFVRMIRKFALYTKEIQEAVLFGLMSNSFLFFALSGSPLFYVMMPFMGVLMTIITILKGYDLVKAKNKNFDQWFGFVVSLLCTILASVAFYGAALAAAYDFSFVIAPWFFLGSNLVAMSYELVMLGVSFYRAYESPDNSMQRMHYVQAIMKHLFKVGLLISTLGATLLVLLFPVAAPALGTIFAWMSVSFILLNIAWKIIPHHWKLFIKEGLSLGKPEIKIPDKTSELETDLSQKYSLVEEQPFENGLHQKLNATSVSAENQIVDAVSEDSSTAPAAHLVILGEIPKKPDDVHHPRLFTRPDHQSIVSSMSWEKGKKYLDEVIVQKIEGFKTQPYSEKTYHKVECLYAIEKALDQQDKGKINNRNLAKTYPWAFQNFWSEKSEVEQIANAARTVIENYNQNDNHSSTVACYARAT